MKEILKAIADNTYIWHDEDNKPHTCYHKEDLWKSIEILTAQKGGNPDLVNMTDDEREQVFRTEILRRWDRKRIEKFCNHLLGKPVTAQEGESDEEITMRKVSEFCEATKPYNDVFSIGQLRNWLTPPKAGE